MSTNTYVYVGTYSQTAPHTRTSRGKGIYVYRLDPDSGALTFCCEATGIDNASYLAVDPGKRYLYAISEVRESREGLVSAYAIDQQTGALTYQNQQASMGTLPCYVSVDRTSRWVLVANFMGGNVAVFPILPDGRLGEATHVVRHTGSGKDPERQNGPHPHCIVLDPANRFAYAADLGIDKIMSYRLDLDGGRLMPNDPPFVTLEPGSGPRHFVFHPSGRFAFVIRELDSMITAFACNTLRGSLEIQQSVPTLPAGYTGESSCGEIQVHPSGRFLFGSNRGHDSIVIFAIDEATGWLTYIGHQPTGGEMPRHFAIDPSGTFLLAANLDSDNIVTFRIDQKTGRLDRTCAVAQVPNPRCVKMIDVP